MVSKPQRQTIFNFRKCTSDSGTLCGQLLSPSHHYYTSTAGNAFPGTFWNYTCSFHGNTYPVISACVQLLLRSFFDFAFWCSTELLEELISVRPWVHDLACSFCALNLMLDLTLQKQRWSVLPFFMRFWSSSVLTMHLSPMQSDIFIFKHLLSHSYQRRLQTRAVLGLMLKELSWSLHSCAAQPTVASFSTSSLSIPVLIPIFYTLVSTFPYSASAL